MTCLMNLNRNLAEQFKGAIQRRGADQSEAPFVDLVDD